MTETVRPAGTTIVAVATPEGRGGLAVVRLSGPDALAVARRVLPGGELADPVASHRARLASVRWPSGAATGAAGPKPGAELDQALVLPLLAPASFTGEDTVEFFCHGGPQPARLIVDACRAAGAQAAGPGEFTRRAFLSGRLSLSQAEAVADLIAAENAAGARAALAQLRGGLAREATAIEAPLRGLLARLEGSLEFEEHEAAGPDPDAARKVLADARARVAGLLALAPAGRRLRDGVQVVLAGPPNAGKSALFNALLGRPRALVDTEPGTTRDVVAADLDLDGVRFVLHDTAGLREAPGRVEALGADLARQAVAAADIVVELSPFDAADDPPPAGSVAAAPGSVRIVVRSKGDLDPAGGAGGGEVVVTSAVTGAGLDVLRERLVREARRGGLDEAIAQGVLLNQRHQDRLRSCRHALDGLLAGPWPGEEVVATMLAAALQDLGELSGRVFSEQLLDEVFSRFCVGK